VPNRIGTPYLFLPLIEVFSKWYGTCFDELCFLVTGLFGWAKGQVKRKKAVNKAKRKGQNNLLLWSEDTARTALPPTKAPGCVGISTM
jgi:hypothetical protein